jgi:Spy/CpxP family protein refolding chaperone
MFGQSPLASQKGINSMNARIRLFLQLVAVVACSWSVSVAQPPGPPQGGGPGGPGGFGGPFGGNGLLGLAMRDEVQQELQLVDEQQDKVRALSDDMRSKVRDEMGGMFQQLRDVSDEERRAKFDEIRKKFEAINTDMEKKLDGVLLPHQLERLKQIDLQSKIRQRGASALTGGDVAEALNLSDDQREKLEKRAAEVQEELQTKIRELQADARKKMIDVLTPEQQAQLQKMMGDQFDLPDQNFRGRFGRGSTNGQGGGRNRDQQSTKNGKDAT